MKLKGLLKGLCIFGLTLLPISFSSAYTYKQDFDIPDTFVKGNMTYTILKNFNVSTFYQNTTMNRILFSESNLSSNGRNILHSFLAWYEGKLYLYADYVHDGQRSYVYQGFPTQFCLATAGSGESVCVPSGWSCPKNTNIDVFYNAGKLTHGTYYGYGDFSSTYQVWTYCVSDDINDYCFNISADSYNCGSSYLTGSLNVPGTSIDDLMSFEWGSSKFSPTSMNNVPYENGVPCFTVGELFQTSDKYNTGLCYSSSKIFSGGSFISVVPKSILELFPTYNDFRDSINTYTNYCTPPATTNACQSAFEGQDEQWSLINKIPADVRSNNLYDLCSMYINYGLDTNVCSLTGTQITPSYFTSEGYAEYLRQQGITTLIPGSGSVFDTLNGYSDSSTDSLFGIKQLFSNIMSFFSAYNGNEGILPSFIGFFVVAFALLYLFKK